MMLILNLVLGNTLLETGNTLGFYWCDISSAVNVSLRPSNHSCTPAYQHFTT